MLGSWVRGLGVVGGRVGNKICSMSTNGLSSDHVQAFSLLSSLRLRRKRFLPILSLPLSLLLSRILIIAPVSSLFLSLFLQPIRLCNKFVRLSLYIFSNIIQNISFVYHHLYITHIKSQIAFMIRRELLQSVSRDIIYKYILSLSVQIRS